MITLAQVRAARALLGIGQRPLARRAGVSLPTIQRMEASEGLVCDLVDTLAEVVAALERDGIELIDEQAPLRRGRTRRALEGRGRDPGPAGPPRASTLLETG